jgi:hypothetical protein
MYNSRYAADVVGPELGGLCGGGVECGCEDVAAEDGRRACQRGYRLARAATECLIHRDSLGKPAGARRIDPRAALFQLLLPASFRPFRDRSN